MKMLKFVLPFLLVVCLQADTVRNNIKFGLNQTSGATDNNIYNAKFTNSVEMEKVTSDLEVDWKYQKTNDMIVENQKAINYHLEYNNHLYFPFAIAEYLDDLKQHVSDRYTFGLGYGYYIFKEPSKYMLSVSLAGLRIDQQENVFNAGRFEERAKYIELPLIFKQRFYYQKSDGLYDEDYYNQITLDYMIYKSFTIGVSDTFTYDNVALQNKSNNKLLINLGYTF